MSDTLHDRIARALYNECLNQDAYVETACGKYVPDPTDPNDWITVDGRLSFAELADAVICELSLREQWRADLGYDGYSNCQTQSEAVELVDDFNTGLVGEVQDGEQAVVMRRYATEWTEL